MHVLTYRGLHRDGTAASLPVRLRAASALMVRVELSCSACHRTAQAKAGGTSLREYIREGKTRLCLCSSHHQNQDMPSIVVKALHIHSKMGRTTHGPVMRPSGQCMRGSRSLTLVSKSMTVCTPVKYIFASPDVAIYDSCDDLLGKR